MTKNVMISYLLTKTFENKRFSISEYVHASHSRSRWCPNFISNEATPLHSYLWQVAAYCRPDQPSLSANKHDGWRSDGVPPRPNMEWQAIWQRDQWQCHSPKAHRLSRAACLMNRWQVNPIPNAYTIKTADYSRRQQEIPHTHRTRVLTRGTRHTSVNCIVYIYFDRGWQVPEGF